MAFVQRLLQFTFTLAQGQFAGGGNTKTIIGKRASCKIAKVGGSSSGTMEGAIFGMLLQDMNQLTTMGTQLTKTYPNFDEVLAGDGDGNGNPVGQMSPVFSGHMFNVFMDGQAQPQVPFRFQATADGYERVKPAPSTSVSGSADVAQLMGTLAGQMGFSFENNGVNVKLANPYFSGSPRVQAREIAEAAGIEHIVDNGKLAIWIAGQSRQGAATLVSPQTGMVGYPTFYSAAVVVESLFNPAIQFGQRIQVQSDITAACGTWETNKIEYELDTLTPHGRWFQTMTAFRANTQEAGTS
jgi:hypothetical protein